MNYVFARGINRLIYAAVNEHCDGCKMDCLSQMHHTACSPTDEHQAWAFYSLHVKRDLDIEKLMLEKKKKVEDKLDLQVNETWLKHLLHLSTGKEGSACSEFEQNFQKFILRTVPTNTEVF